ncbi:hypothetical protein PflQ8_2434 [Pseudomonas fluorescens Q8r1-96]|nr:hypothetical protein PflQ8_2434 [Pseudomonas fluorescens Q8r1-96]
MLLFMAVITSPWRERRTGSSSPFLQRQLVNKQKAVPGFARSSLDIKTVMLCVLK